MSPVRTDKFWESTIKSRRQTEIPLTTVVRVDNPFGVNSATITDKACLVGQICLNVVDEVESDILVTTWWLKVWAVEVKALMVNQCCYFFMNGSLPLFVTGGTI